MKLRFKDKTLKHTDTRYNELSTMLQTPRVLEIEFNNTVSNHNYFFYYI